MSLKPWLIVTLIVSLGFLTLLALQNDFLKKSISKPTIQPNPLETPLSTASPKLANDCVIGGCSQELCVDPGVDPSISICIYRPHWKCYKTAKCERQDNGKCGWTQTPELTNCLQEKSNSSTSEPYL
ncbi:hypothetical protein A2961_02070 [Candidatus Woesebacteria bacterium RIFCSPLOWO2_01_FULL_39_21]|uniref:Uncharacterized protein n=1 Tax=Candidatus Woesebacteria bacterium RIFCSPLOWO2_01_FULL_39_21 TaxID=1802519 RepID=A0A1F8BH07_9BACT|nr:MAG: hypothetical protein A2691_04300 [Candidatus Woesebacteria bacterium RIFCSPHIGHO2_01_FULL_39_23]OGM63313.1 MAG: hypothetical protein A2961_02070 [Candidatus Woesebacteria bacterium RIFCSPLOWO2_01_FULL_39_21]